VDTGAAAQHCEKVVSLSASVSMPGTVSVLETSGDTDEPPNLGGERFLFFLLAVSLLVTRVPLASATLSLPPDTPFKLYLASLNILEYKRPLARGERFAFIEVELSKSSDVSVQEATLGYSVSECQGPLLAQSPLNLTESEGDGVVTGVASLPLSLLQLEASGDKVDLCLQASVSRNKGPLFRTPWRLQRSLDLHQLKGEQMLEQCLALPPSPMVASQRGTSQSLSNNQDSGVGSGRVSSSGPPPLKKTDTRTSFGESKRSASAEGALPLPQASHSARQQCWIPDYSVRAMSDLMYLKVRRQTYLVAIKASRMNNMNSDSGGLKMNEEEISDVLAKVIENEDDEFGGTPSIRSPDKSWDGGGTMLTSNAGTPTEFRRESIRSSLSMMKQKFLGGQGGGRSNSSIDKTGQQIRPSDEFWGELGSTNPAMTKEGDDFGEKVAQIGSYAESHTNGPLSLPLNGSTKGGVGMKGETATTISRDMSEPMMSRGNNLPDVEMGGEVVGGGRAGNATVISVSGMQGGGGHGDGSPSDRTSLLNSDSHPVS